VLTRNTTTAPAGSSRARRADTNSSTAPSDIPSTQSPSASSPSRSVCSSASQAAYGMPTLSLPRTLTASTEVVSAATTKVTSSAAGQPGRPATAVPTSTIAKASPKKARLPSRLRTPSITW
jgi:hypothetical protein